MSESTKSESTKLSEEQKKSYETVEKNTPNQTETKAELTKESVKGMSYDF